MIVLWRTFYVFCLEDDDWLRTSQCCAERAGRPLEVGGQCMNAAECLEPIEMPDATMVMRDCGKRYTALAMMPKPKHWRKRLMIGAVLLQRQDWHLRHRGRCHPPKTVEVKVDIMGG
jgi:hypothetical protein